jgi:hypothetical protein
MKGNETDDWYTSHSGRQSAGKLKLQRNRGAYDIRELGRRGKAQLSRRGKVFLPASIITEESTAFSVKRKDRLCSSAAWESS